MAGKNDKSPKGEKPKLSADSMFRLKIVLRGAPVPIWRRIVIKANLPLNLVHQCLQIVMGWWETHSYNFISHERRYGNLEHAEGDPKVLDDTEHVLSDLISAAGEQFVYLYDFDNEWIHDIVLEEIHEGEGEGFVHCLGGRRACPPEDVGGVLGYRVFLDKVEDMANEESLDLLAWAGGDFNADSFDIRGVNLRLILLQEQTLVSPG